MSAVVYMTGRDGELHFDTVALAEQLLRSLGFTPRDGQPGGWVALRDDGNLFAVLVDDSIVDEWIARIERAAEARKFDSA